VMARPLVLVADERLARRLGVLAALAGDLELQVVDPRAERLLREVRTRAPALVLVGQERDGRAVTLARALRTDLRAGVRVVLYADDAGAPPPAWGDVDLAPPEAWVPDARDEERLRASVRAVLAGERRWPAVGPATGSLLARALGRLRSVRGPR
jgi:hypothetical protein